MDGLHYSFYFPLNDKVNSKRSASQKEQWREEED